MTKLPNRVLVVDDYELWRRFASTAIQKLPGTQVLAEACDGLEAVQLAQQLQPDLILLDIGLPTLNGIEAARKIRDCSPSSKIVFVTENRSLDIADEAFRTGASGYVVKSDAGSELLPAVNAVLQGKQFLSASLSRRDLSDATHPQIGAHFRCQNLARLAPALDVGIAHHHEVGFYQDDLSLLDQVTEFIASALKSGGAAVVVATESHRNGLLPRLHAHGLSMGATIEEGRYITADACDALSTFMLNGRPDPARFLKLLGNLIVTAAKAAKGQPGHVTFFGECVNLLWARGNAEAAIQVEKLVNQLAKTYDVDILCGYSPGSPGVGTDDHTFQQICAEHSAVYSR